MRFTRQTLIAAIVLAAAAACGASSNGARVPTVGGSATANGAAAEGSGSSSRAAALHAAAECLRQHGIPNLQDPTLSPDGQVFTDTRALQDASYTKDASGEHETGTVDAARAACEDLIQAADWNPDELPPAPPAMVAAGVRAAECLRAHGLPNVTDPTPISPYTPGHGFGMDASQVPPGGKQDPTFQAAIQACRDVLDGEIDQSSLANLARH